MKFRKSWNILCWEGQLQSTMVEERKHSLQVILKDIPQIQIFVELNCYIHSYLLEINTLKGNTSRLHLSVERERLTLGQAAHLGGAGRTGQEARTGELSPTEGPGKRVLTPES